MRWLGLNVLFATAVCAAWSWYHVAAPTHRVSYRFQIQTNLLGWQFEPVEVPEIARRTLAGTNLFNGIYRGTAGERVAVFAGNWSAENSRELSVVGHTPDVCWVGSGWKPVSLGQPRQIPFRISGQEIPFEVRAFQPPAGGTYELTVWCTVVNGQIYQELDRFEPTDLPQDDRRRRSAETARRVGAAYFWNAIRQRSEATGEKQFIRFSMGTAGDWESSLARLGAFAEIWLAIFGEALSCSLPTTMPFLDCHRVRYRPLERLRALPPEPLGKSQIDGPKRCASVQTYETTMPIALKATRSTSTSNTRSSILRRPWLASAARGPARMHEGVRQRACMKIG